ncbi:hypothetical protein MTO96_030258 [Rhipicephalus appendiculatus]
MILLVAGLLPDTVDMAGEAAEHTGERTRGRLRLEHQSLLDRGCAIPFTAATTLQYIRSSVQGNIRGANAMWIPPERDHYREGSLADKEDCRMASQMAEKTDDATGDRLLAERGLMDRGDLISCVKVTTQRNLGDIQGEGANGIWMPHARNPCVRRNSAVSGPSSVLRLLCPATCSPSLREPRQL